MMNCPAEARRIERLEKIEAAAMVLLPRIESDIHFENMLEDSAYGPFTPPNYGVFSPGSHWKALVEALKS